MGKPNNDWKSLLQLFGSAASSTAQGAKCEPEARCIGIRLGSANATGSLFISCRSAYSDPLPSPRLFWGFAGAIQIAHTDIPWQQIVKGTVAFLAANKGLIRALHLHSRLNPALVPQGSTKARDGLYQALEPLITKQGLDAGARMAAHVMVSAITEAILYPDMTPAAASGLDGDLLVEGLSELLESYSV
jgi:hypothetical protein